MIMAAGAGTRLNPLTSNMPKPMIPVANVPILELILKHLKKSGINDVIANTHYCADSIHNAFGGKNHLGINFSYVYEEALSGTAGGVKACEKFFEEGETFIVVSGDALTNVNIDELYKKHKQVGALASMGLKEVPMEEVDQFGVVVLDENSNIMGFQEKPKQEEAKSNLVNTGIYIFETAIFKYIPENTFYDFAKNVFPSIMENKEKFCGFKIDEYWDDIGTIHQYKISSLEILNGSIDLELPYEKTENGWISKSAKIGKDVTIENKVVIGNNSIIENNVSLKGNNIIGNNCVIKSGTELKDSILWDNVVIEENINLDGCILANNVTVKQNAKVEKDSVISHDSIITD